MATTTPSTSAITSAVPAARAALSGSPSPCRRAATAVRPTPTSSPIETITQTV